jgi:predicted AAA+ superfamily ATPase
MDIANEVLQKCRPLEFFSDYLKQGYYPFGAEGFALYHQRVENIVDMLLNIELPQLRSVDIGNIRKLKALLAIISTEVPMLVDISKLATLTGIARTTILAYLQYLHEAKLIRLLYSDDMSVKKMQKPDKILMENTNLLQALSLKEPNIGTMRETFFCNQLGYKHQVEYNKRGDFLVDRKLIFEIGGKSKDGKQVSNIENAYSASDEFDYPIGNKLPLWLFGLMY